MFILAKLVAALLVIIRRSVGPMELRSSLVCTPKLTALRLAEAEFTGSVADIIDLFSRASASKVLMVSLVRIPKCKALRLVEAEFTGLL